MAGLLVALERVGVDLAAADRIIGTSAGAIIGAMLAGGVDLKALARRPATAAAGRAPERLEPTRSHELLAIMSTPVLSAAKRDAVSARSPSPIAASRLSWIAVAP
jgi:NTE family protein